MLNEQINSTQSTKLGGLKKKKALYSYGASKLASRVDGPVSGFRPKSFAIYRLLGGRVGRVPTPYFYFGRSLLYFVTGFGTEDTLYSYTQSVCF